MLLVSGSLASVGESANDSPVFSSLATFCSVAEVTELASAFSIESIFATSEELAALALVGEASAGAVSGFVMDAAWVSILSFLERLGFLLTGSDVGHKWVSVESISSGVVTSQRSSMVRNKRCTSGFN